MLFIRKLFSLFVLFSFSSSVFAESEIESPTEASEELSAVELLELKLQTSLESSDLETLLMLDVELERLAADFEYGDESLFFSESQLMGFVHSLRAVKALQVQDMGLFEKEVKEAFWLSPSFIPLFQLDQQVQAYQYELQMIANRSNMQVDMESQVQLIDGSSVSLKSLLGDSKALLIDFWASWCGPCMQLMPRLKEEAAHLSAKGVVVMALNTETDSAMLKAKQVYDQFDMLMPWAIEVGEDRLNRELQIDSIPQMVLLSPEGKILFQGHPLDKGLEKALGSL